MQMVTEHDRWCASGDEGRLLAWAADRATATGRHLAPLVAVGRLPDGRLAVDVERPTGTPLVAALDGLGVPTTGVAVTLTVPLLELAAAERAGAVRIGTAGLDDVLVDDAGAVVVCDRPDGAAPCDRPDAAAPCDRPDAAAPRFDRPDAVAARFDRPDGAAPCDRPAAVAPRLDRPDAAVPPTPRAPSTHGPVQDGSRTLLVAARVVWERTDPRDPARAPVDPAIAAALDGDAASVHAALDAVRATAAPRPVRWEPPALDVLVGFPAPASARSDGGLGSWLREVVERGVPLGAGRRVPLRRALVGVVVAVGIAAAGVVALG